MARTRKSNDTILVDDKKDNTINPSTSRFDDNKQYWCYTVFGSIKHYGKQLNIAKKDYLSQFIKFEEINKL